MPFQRQGNRIAKLSLLNQKGLSLVEVMVVVGILSIIGAGITTMMVNANKQARSVGAKGDFNSLVNTLQGVFNNSSTCYNAFTTKTIAAIPTKITLDLGGQQIKEGEKYGNTLSIESLDITAIDNTSEPDIKLMTLKMVANRSMGGQAAVGGDLLTHDFRLTITRNASNQMTSCSGQYENFWSAVGTTGDITRTTGNVGLGMNPSGVRLDVNGTIQADVYLYRSDRRLKDNIRNIQDPLEKVLSLHGVIYNWKNPKDDFMSQDQLGFIAQEVEKVFPEAVVTHPQSGLKSVSYANLVAPLVEAVKLQQDIIMKQQKEIEEIKKQLRQKQR